MTSSARQFRIVIGELWPLLALLILLAAVVWVLWPLSAASALPNPPWPTVEREPPDRQETLLLAPTTLAPQARVRLAPRVVVYDPARALPHAGVWVRATLSRQDDPAHVPLARAQATTDHLGTAAPVLSLSGADLGPLGKEPIILVLAVEVSGPVGEQRLVHQMTVEPDVVFTLLTDRSRYRPGQTIHLLAHVDSTAGLLGAEQAQGAEVLLTVADAQGILLCKETCLLSPSGLAAVDCPLSEQAHPGAYRITAALADRTRGLDVYVEPETLSPYPVTLRADNPFYAPGEKVRLTLHAAQPWGAPLPAAAVTVTISAEVATSAKAAPPRELARLEGTTDESGDVSFVLSDDMLSDEALLDEPHLLLLDAAVRGPGDHGRTLLALPAASQPFRVDVVTERGDAASGTLVPGIENQISVRVTYPDRRPAQATLHASAPGLEQPLVLETDAQGRVAWPYLPEPGQVVPWTLVARDVEGRETETTVKLPVEPGPAFLLLRPERSRCTPGETLHVDAWYIPPPDVPQQGQPLLLVDLLQDGQATGSAATRLDAQNHAVLDLTLPADLAFGPLELRAVVVHAAAETTAPPAVDVRLLQVVPNVEDTRPAGELEVQLYADRTAYAPGETAQLVARVQDSGQTGRSSALTVALVSPETSPAHTRARQGRDAQQPAQELAALQAGALSVPRPLPPGTKERFDTVGRIRQARREALGGPAQRIAWAGLALLCLAWIAALAGAWEQRQRYLGRLLGGVLLLALAAGAAVLLAYGGAALFGPGAAIVLGLAWLGALAALGVQTWLARSRWGQFLWATAGAALALMLGLGYARQQGAPLAPSWIAAALGGGLGHALALIFYGLGQARREQRWVTAAAWATAFVLLVTLSGLAWAPVTASAPESAAEALASRLAGQQPVDDPAAARPERDTIQLPLPGAAHKAPAAIFPQTVALETAAWLPEARTTVNGERPIQISLPELDGQAHAAWRVAVQAWGEDGAAGHTETLLSISRPLWLDAPLPAALTVGDELDLPLSVYNPLSVTQTIQITLSEAAWFQVRASETQSLTVPGHAVSQAVLPLTVREGGLQRLEILAQSQQGRAAYSRPVDVAPNGGRVWRVFTGRLPPAEQASLPETDILLPSTLPAPQGPITAPLPSDRWRFRVPWLALRGTDRVTITLYRSLPGPVLAEGLSVSALPDRPVSLDELAAATRVWALQDKPISPDAASGLYQRFLGYRAPGEGFGAWPGEPPDLLVSAQALTALADLAQLTFVDPAILDRAASWLLDQQTEQGTWIAAVPPSWERLPRLELPATAQVTASLLEAGYGRLPEVRLAAEHLARYLDKAQDPYVLALVSHVLVEYDKTLAGETARLAPPALDRLAEMAQSEGADDERQAAWRGEIETLSGASGPAADVEVTALAVTALIRAGAQPELAAQALAWLADQRDARGSWGAPQTHDLVLGAFLAAAAAEQTISALPDIDQAAQVYVSVDDIAAPPQTLDRSPERESVALSFDQLSKGYNEIVLARGGQGDVRYRIVGTYLMPWDELPASSPDEALSFDLAYDRTSIAVGESITATLTLTPTRQRTASGIVLELGLPPGLDVEKQEWDALVDDGAIDRYRQDEQTMIVRLTDLPAEGPLRFTYRLRSLYPLSVWAPPSRAYPAGDPLRAAVRAPIAIEVRD